MTKNGIKLRDGRHMFIEFQTITGMAGEPQEIMKCIVDGKVVHYEGIKAQVPPHYQEIIAEISEHIAEENNHMIAQFIK